MKTQRDDSDVVAASLAELAGPEKLRLQAALTEAFIAGRYRAIDIKSLRALVEPLDFNALFAGKEDCFIQVFDQIVAETRDSILASDRPADPWSSRLATGVWTLLTRIDAQPSAAGLVLVQARFATPAIFRRFAKARESVAPFMREGRLAAGSRMPEVSDTFLPGGVAALLANHLKAANEEPVLTLYHSILRFLLPHYLADAEVAVALSGSRVSRGRPDGPLVKSSLGPEPICAARENGRRSPFPVGAVADGPSIPFTLVGRRMRPSTTSRVGRRQGGTPSGFSPRGFSLLRGRSLR
jgi:AcrR family transcriptional regulator